MTYQKAKLHDDGDLLLPPGHYFIDTSKKKFLKVLDELTEIGVQQKARGSIDDGKGNIMIHYDIDEENFVPRSIVNDTGFFYLMPDGESLSDVSMNIYGYLSNPTEGFWEWLAENHSTAFQGAQAIADGVDTASEATKEVLSEAADTISKTVSKTFDVAKPLVYVGISVVAFIFFNNYYKNK